MIKDLFNKEYRLTTVLFFFLFYTEITLTNMFLSGKAFYIFYLIFLIELLIRINMHSIRINYRKMLRKQHEVLKISNNLQKEYQVQANRMANSIERLLIERDGITSEEVKVIMRECFDR